MSYPEDFDECVEVPLVTQVDYTEITDRLDVMQDFLCQCSVDNSAITNAKLDIIDSGLRQILLNLGDEINENEVAIENTAKTMVMII